MSNMEYEKKLCKKNFIEMIILWKRKNIQTCINFNPFFIAKVCATNNGR